MFINKSMTEGVITVAPESSVLEAKKLMEKNNVRHLPVVEDGNLLVGIITDRDVRSACPSVAMHDFDSRMEREKMERVKVKDVMTRDPVTISPIDTIQDALLLFEKYKFGAFPVVDQNRVLKGILSVRDLVRAFINVLGIGEGGTLLGILVEQKVGQMKKIVDIITSENISMGSIVVVRHWSENKRAVFPYLLTSNVVNVKKKFVEAGYTLLDPMDWYMDKLRSDDD
jgi:acetoin utilization protein AcuB